ncbi:MAG: ABC transporter ATP-binding protein, partial [archaeon]|nr:ABC transporter ATP-binding protein [archaeon]
EVRKLLHIEDLAYRKYNELSAGLHQKVTIARGLVQETPVVILDEPTANLDVQYQVYVTEMLRAIAESKGLIVLMICHDLNIAAKYSHRIIMLARPGVVHAVGTPEEVITEENLEAVYHIRNRIISDDKSSAKEGMEVTVPHVILGEAIIEDDQ